MEPHMIWRNLTNLRWNLTIRWRLSGGEWYPFRGVPDDMVQRWAVIRPNMREDQVDVVLKAEECIKERGLTC
jgi:hypothetical protein